MASKAQSPVPGSLKKLEKVNKIKQLQKRKHTQKNKKHKKQKTNTITEKQQQTKSAHNKQTNMYET